MLFICLYHGELYSDSVEKLPVFQTHRQFNSTVFNVDFDNSLTPTEICLFFFFQCKEWGFLLREVFGCNLGTSDYGHITTEHASSMLFRNHLNLREYSNQGFEAARSYSLQCQLCSKATSHDRHGHATSSQFYIFLFQYFIFLYYHTSQHYST